MSYTSVYDGVVFIEGSYPNAIIKEKAGTRIAGIGAHFRTLDDLKSKMAKRAKKLGCNCIVNFTYGQKTKIISIDNINYVGNGWNALLPRNDYENITKLSEK